MEWLESVKKIVGKVAIVFAIISALGVAIKVFQSELEKVQSNDAASNKSNDTSDSL